MVADVFEVFLRLNRLGLDNFTIRQAAKIIISQRLIPKLCSRCKVIDLVNTNKLRTTIYKSTGCAACDYSGYHGRTLLVESLYLDNQIKELLCKESELDAEKLKKSLAKGNYNSFKEHFLEKLCQGEISLEHMFI